MAVIFNIVDKELFIQFAAEEEYSQSGQKPYGLRFTQMAQFPGQEEGQGNQNKTESQVKNRARSRGSIGQAVGSKI